ncbi:MAG: hypothetical protein KC656_05370 [Myxococcales bacterium]|nr:hypothetical protein [Myxococcales bacterium]MCB9669936.1 hypothetical protein [Alphaproteobacteria bacterium]MCB9693190.1 hypothetical protein [Alphaproteobacteria bacterium]
MIALLSLALGAPVVAERIDVFSEDGAAWWFDDLPRARATPRITALRWAEQVRFVARTPDHPVFFGASLAAQSVGVRGALGRGVVGSTALLTRLGLPSGAWVGVASWRGPMRVGVSVVATSGASWRRPRWDHWGVLPSVSVGFGRAPDPGW